MSVFACPIIARSQCWLFDLRANISTFASGQISLHLPSNIRIGPQISVFAPNLTSGIWAVVPKKISQSTRKDGA